MMRDPTAHPTLDRLVRHVAWVNAAFFGWLALLPDEALALAAPRNEWGLAVLPGHVVDRRAPHRTLAQEPRLSWSPDSGAPTFLPCARLVGLRPGCG